MAKKKASFRKPKETPARAKFYRTGIATVTPRDGGDLIDVINMAKAKDGYVAVKFTRADGCVFEGRMPVPVAVDVSNKLMLASASAEHQKRGES